jgi:hypothetical protein
MVGDAGGLADVLLRARVGWALYDSGFPQYSFGDSLKTKDYLAAGMRVVSTLPQSVDDGIIATAQCSVPAVVEATRQALVQPPLFDPLVHAQLTDAKRSLRMFVSTVCAVL